MLSKDRLDFIAHLTDWFRGHLEDQGWGKRSATQILVALAVRDLAEGIQDAELRGQIHAAADEVIVRNSQTISNTMSAVSA